MAFENGINWNALLGIHLAENSEFTQQCAWYEDKKAGEKKSSYATKNKNKKYRPRQDSNLRPVARNRFLVYRLRPLDHVVIYRYRCKNINSYELLIYIGVFGQVFHLPYLFL